MKRLLVLTILHLSVLGTAKAQNPTRDSVRVGIYITSIHDIDFKEKEYSITFWLWMKYKNPNLNFQKYLEIPNAKSYETSFYTSDTTDERIYLIMKVHAVMEDSWKVTNFPFDRQNLRLSIENSQYDQNTMVFVPETVGSPFDPQFALRGWNIDSCNISTGLRTYETSFGLESLPEHRVDYSTFKVNLSISRDTVGLFWKMFVGMYLAFLIAFICFFIHADLMDARFGLSVGSLFAVVGNKYIIESSLPETGAFTLVDLLHDFTLFFILMVVVANAYSLEVFKNHGLKRSDRFDRRVAWVLMGSFVLINAWFIWRASRG
jgi:hypothetical protein